MPELPEIEVTRRTIHERLVGLRVERVALKQSGKTEMLGAVGMPLLEGRDLSDTGRRGKMILLRFADDLTLIVHLMLIGRIALYKGELPRPTNPVLKLRFEEEQYLEVRFVAARSLALLPTDQVDTYPMIAKHGPDALDITLDQFQGAVKRTRGAVKNALTEQELVAGIGNAYSDEILYEARIHPLTPASELGTKQVAKLHEAIAPVLLRAIDMGAAEEYVLYLGRQESKAELTSKKDLMRVHNREGEACPSCGSPVERVELAGRGTFFCPREQVR